MIYYLKLLNKQDLIFCIKKTFLHTFAGILGISPVMIFIYIIGNYANDENVGTKILKFLIPMFITVFFFGLIVEIINIIKIKKSFEFNDQFANGLDGTQVEKQKAEIKKAKEQRKYKDRNFG